jgi:ABC-type phosphate/phosphonate transport system substrate-binding protein
VEDVRGKRIGYVSTVSSSGYLFPRDLLRQDGLDPNTFFGSSRLYQTHDQVLAAVVAGEVDVGAAIDMSLDWSRLTTPADSLNVIGKSRRIPHDCVVARGSFDEETALAFRDTLLAMRASDPEMKSILPGLHVNGWVRADEARYDVVREVMEREAQAASRN